MVVEIKVEGAEQLRALAVDLRAAGEEGKGLRRALLASMRAAGKPLAEAARESARSVLPKRGGLNEWVADSKFAVRNSLTGSKVGMRIVATKGKHDLDDIDKGSLRHPVYGNRKKWVGQSVASGFFTKPLEKTAPEVRAALLVAMNVTAHEIERN